MADANVLIDSQLSGSWWQYHQWKMDQPLQSGDSGGPVMYANKAFGTATAGTRSTWYTTVDNIANGTGHRPCITAYNNPCR